MASDGRPRPPRPARTLRARLAVLLGGVAVFLVVTLGVQLTFQGRLSDEQDRLVRRIDRAAVAVGDLRSAVVDQETGVRGYALSGVPLFLEPYERGRGDADAVLDALRSFVADAPGLGAEFDAVVATLGAWRRDTAEPGIAAAGAGQVVTEEDLEAGREQFGAVRGAIDVLADDVEREREAGLDDLDRAFTWVVVTMLGQVGGLVVLGAIIAVALDRQVVHPLARLGAAVRQVAQGDLARRVEAHGSPELVRLGEDVDAMRARIVEELDLLNRIRAELEEQAAELVRSNEDLEQFAYVASHDLQEPLRKVSGFCQLLQKRYGDQLDDRAREYIWYAGDGARRMQDLINDLLTFSRVGRTTASFGPVDLGAVTAEVVRLLAEAERLGDDVTIDVGELPTVSGDRRLLHQVVQNLVGNALKFRRREPLTVRVDATDDGHAWTIGVSDNGIGIDPAYADQIFTIFKRLHTKTEYEGTGIGLALSKKIVEFHGGRIWLDPTAAPGATFRFTLPHDPVDPEVAPTPPRK